ncbi:hypothetical protein [Acidithiobacillus ferridurans]|uniref:Uncharacterized protein n=1 Tax=Acidithiobacillus ferridurans TaxID=1232575 RepID=A0A8X8KB77_ACIFI|nr:hypothetical protein [Acidithiobacillus ferridurans]MBU2715598.1 hypothetical protein [Acidithiobacillus ferridurans]MBU2722912.1 hypothetical protein [Acidithiobacillus ferridurans]MBU2728196.1 hypothetical protein [Acidithiobacillus ferridurans]
MSESTKTLKDLTFAECVVAFAAPEGDPYVEAARKKTIEGELEVDDRSVLSRSDDGGQYVMAWLWVTDEEAGVS